MAARTITMMTLAASLLSGCVDDGMVVGTSDVPLSDVDTCEAAVNREAWSATTSADGALHVSV